jgi:putative FmdB family regulatory protein
MPNYTYACLDCKRKVDRYHRITEEPDERCPYCGGIMERIICFEGHVILKGAGFHKNDYMDPVQKEDLRLIEECERKNLKKQSQ